MCIHCKKEKPIYCKKRGLCRQCYGQIRKKQGSFINPKTHDYKAGLKEYEITREVEFIKNFFEHNNWLHQPAVFRFNGEKYSPDFYDIDRNVFIEVSGSRQAYHQAKEKYASFREHFPQINFEIRKSDGSLLNEETRDKSWHTIEPRDKDWHTIEA